jgi:hypothetical protein
MWRRLRFVLALLAWLPGAVALAAQDTSTVPSAPEARPGYAAPRHVVAEIQRALDDAIGRFDARDEAGLLAHVSDQYRTSDLTKAGIADQLRTVFAFHDQVRARVHIDDVRMVGEVAWVYSTGKITGRVRYIGGYIVVASWERELEVARRENGRWRLFGYQQ